MKGLSKFLGRGLLVLALGSCFVACGDDDDGPSEVDGGPDGGGTGGTAGTSGRGGTGGTSGRGGTGGAAGEGGVPNCEAEATKASMSVMSNADCVECLCDMKPSATIACTGDCWKLAYCVAASGCGSSDTTCIRAACTTTLGGMEKYMAAATLAVAVPFTMCAADCFPVDPDAGTADAGR